MTYRLGTLIRTAKRYASDTSISDEAFTNALLEPYVIAAKVTARQGKEFYLDGSRVSKIINGECCVPTCLTKACHRHGLEQRVAEEFNMFFDEAMDDAWIDSLRIDLLALIDTGDERQRIVAQELEVASTPATFMAKALIGAIKLSNRTTSEKVLWKHGTGSLCVRKGDLLSFGFRNRKKSKNLVAIPVDRSFETHVTRAYENIDVKKVSEKTIHGQWLTRMQDAGISECDLSSRIGYKLSAVDGARANPIECYPIGTVVPIETERAVFLLLAVSKFDDKGNAHASRQDIELAILALLKHYDQKGQGADLYLPLIGTGMSRAGLTCFDSYQLIQKVVTSSKVPICGRITIVVRDESSQDIGLAI